MTVEAVRTALEAEGWSGEILEFTDSSATVELAATQAGTEPRRIAKTLAFSGGQADEGAILVVTAGDARVNGGQFKREFGAKPSMLKAAEVETRTGYPVGGVCPFANPADARVFLDESLRRFHTVFPAAGSAHSAVEMTIAELERFSNSRGWVDVCTGWREE